MKERRIVAEKVDVGVLGEKAYELGFENEKNIAVALSTSSQPFRILT